MADNKTPSPIEDTYFLNPELALKVAGEQNRFMLAPGKEVLQICYYNGAQLPKSPLPNLINVPAGDFTDFFLKYSRRLPTRINCRMPGLSGTARQEAEASLTLMLDEVRALLQKQKDSSPTLHQSDSYFLDRDQALVVALQKNRVYLQHPTIDGLQVCYYSGMSFTNPPDNLIHVDANQFINFFVDTRLRLPVKIVLPQHATMEQKNKLAGSFKKLLEEVIRQRETKAKILHERAQSLAPFTEGDTPLRILLMTSRVTEVMQYSTKGLAKAFDRMGHDVLLLIEQSEMEEMRTDIFLQAHVEFNPHVVININHLFNSWLAPEVFNIVWWQDALPEITAGEKLNWRQRDIVFSLYPYLDKLLGQCGALEIYRQGFCLDTEVFHSSYPVVRKKKIVFIGSSYILRRNNLPSDLDDIVNLVISLFSAGQPLTDEFITPLMARSGLSAEQFFRDIVNFTVRDTCVRWLCESSHMEVEIYGRYWDYDKTIRPFYKGEIPHGKEVARIYNEAEYAMVALPQEINSQRLVEISACGCVPVVYDCRYRAEKPHWDEECLFFKTKDELIECLKKKPTRNPMAIHRNFTYDRMAQRIAGMIREKLANTTDNFSIPQK